MSDRFYGVELALLEAVRRRDFDALGALLSDEFLITTAGWLAGPADKPALRI